MLTQEDIIYFVLTDRFHDGDPANKAGVDKSHPLRYHGGDFQGIIDKIPYLRELGVTALWITPVYLSVGPLDNGAEGYHGYWAMDFTRIDPHLYTQTPGANEGARIHLKNLCDVLHQNQLKLILDMVVNHTGYHTPRYAAYARQLPEAWFNRGGSGLQEGELAGLPDLDHDNPNVRDYFVNNIVEWIEDCGIDAIRMDTVKHVEDPFWYYFKAYVKGRHRQITLIGEVLDEHDIASIARYQTRHDFDTLFDFPLRSAMVETLVRGGPMTLLARPRLDQAEPPGVLDLDTEFYANANRLVTLLDNHDLRSRIKTEILDTWGHWDRQRANRILELCLSFLFTTRGIPQLYYGTEIGLEGGSDPHNRRDMRWEIFDPHFIPHPDDTEFRDAREIYDHTRTLIRIRRQNPSLSVGYLFTLYVDHFVYVYLRNFKENTVIVAINNGLEPMPAPLPVVIEANANLPRRIKDQLARSALVNLLDAGETLHCTRGRIFVKMAGKQAKLFKCLE